MANVNIGQPVTVNVEKDHLTSSTWILFRCPSRKENVISSPSLTVLAAISRPYLAQETVQLTPLEDFIASSFDSRKYLELCLLTAEPTSQVKSIRTFATWCQSLGSYMAPGDNRAQVTSSDNTAQWRTLSSYCANLETVDGQISWNLSHLLWTQQSIVPPAYHYVITGRQPNIGLPRLPHNEPTNQSPTAYGMQI